MSVREVFEKNYDGGTTGFIYRVCGEEWSEAEIDAMNQTACHGTPHDCLELIGSKGSGLSFDHVENETFNRNLLMIDGCLPRVLGSALLILARDGNISVDELARQMTHYNPLELDTDFAESLYGYKLRNFVRCAALGMVPTAVWNGRCQIDDEHAIEIEGGVSFSHNMFTGAAFVDYLYSHTKMQAAPECPMLYRGKDGKLYLRLSLQLRL